jgi:hypothetical protein
LGAVVTMSLHSLAAANRKLTRTSGSSGRVLRSGQMTSTMILPVA